MSLPFDVFESIGQILADKSSPGTDSLRALSQTCKSMVPLARKHLFSSLELKTDVTGERLDTVLSSNPEIARYVRYLKYGIIVPIPKYVYRILELVKRSPSLRRLQLWTESQLCRWDKLPLRMRELLTALIQIPNITDLNIWRFYQFPSSILLGCTHITHFSCAVLVVAPNTTPRLLEQNERLTPRPQCLTVEVNGFDALATFLREDTIDFSRVQHANFGVHSSGDLQIVASVLRRMEDLHTLEIRGEKRVALAGLGEALMENPHKTLKKLVFIPHLVLDEEHPDPLYGLNSELKIIAGNNVIEELDLDLMILMDDDLRTDTEEWPIFDALLTTAGAFPALKRVSVDILWALSSEESRDILLSLADWEEQFVKLSKSQSVEFTFHEVSQV